MSEPEIVDTEETKPPAYYPMVLQSVGADGKLYGLRVLEDGTVEYFGDYDPDGKTRELHRAMGPAMVKVFPRVPILQVRKQPPGELVHPLDSRGGPPVQGTLTGPK